MLNLAIIAEELGEAVETSSLPKNLELNLAGVRLYSEKITNPDCNWIYVVAENTVEAVARTHPEITLAFCGEHPLPENRGNWLCFKTGFSIVEILTFLQQIFETYNRWEMCVLQAAAEGKSLNEILAICAQKLKNPIALFDKTLVLLGTGGHIPDDHLDFVWSEVMALGYYPMENDDQEDVKLFRESRVPFILRYGEVTKVQAFIRKEDKIIACIGTTDLNAPYSTGQLSILYIVQKLLEQISIQTFKTTSGELKTDFILERLLGGFAVQDSLITYYRQSIQWPEDKPYQIAYFILPEGNYENIREDYLTPLLFSLSNYLPKSVVYPYEQGIVVIVGNSSKKTFTNNRKLLTLIEKYKMQAAVSDTYENFSHLHLAFLQCKAAMEIAAEAEDEIHFFEDIHQQYTLHLLARSTRTETLCHPKILELVKQNKHGRQFIESLQVYLIHGRNISAAANQLHLHRNTLIYRIEQMEKILGIDLKAATEPTLFYLYLSCLIVLNHTQNEMSTIEKQHPKQKV